MSVGLSPARKAEGEVTNGLAAFKLLLLVYGGAQWGWTVMTVGIGIGLAVVPVAA